MTVPLFGVITILPIWGPLALLALVSPFLFSGLALFVRRWLALLTVASLGSTLFLIDTWLGGHLREAGLDQRRVFWAALGVLGLIGTIWSRSRQRRAVRRNQEDLLSRPRRAEQLSLWIFAAVGILPLGYGLLHEQLNSPLGRGFLLFWVVISAGALHIAYVRRTGSASLESAWGFTTEGIMLAALSAIAFVFCVSPTRSLIDQDIVKVLWTFEPVERGAIVSSPAVDGDRAYVAAIRDSGLSPSGVVYCLNQETGAVVWQFDDGRAMQQMISSPCLANGRLYVGEGMHPNFRCKLYCLEAATGQKLWHFEAAGHIESSPCVADRKVYFGAGDDGLYCLDADTGSLCWHFAGPFHIDTTPAVAGSRVFAGAGVSMRYKNTEALCFDAETGSVLWRNPTRLPVWGSPSVDGHQVFFGLGTGRLERSADPGETPAGALLCLDITTGKELWTRSVSEGVFGRASVGRTHVYFGSRNGSCYCVDRHSGAILWSVNLGSPVIAEPILSADRLYLVAAEGKVCCLDPASGGQLWSFDLAACTQTRPRLYSTPAVTRIGWESLHHRLILGTELRNPISSAAVVYCLED
jgi:outer membrane protein assembly factor BamB